MLALLLTLLATSASPAVAADSPFANQIESYEKQKSSQTSGWQTSRDRQVQDWSAFEKRVRQKWADGLMPAVKTYAEYFADDRSRLRVDFEKGEAQIETLIRSEKDSFSKEDQVKLVEEGLRRALQDGAGSSSLLGDQLETSDGQKIDLSNYQEWAIRLAGRLRKTGKVKAKDGVERELYSVSLPMVSEHIMVRARKLAPLAAAEASRRSLPLALVLAIIRQESAFNPRARSHIPAFGLMQIVPKYAGREVVSFLSESDALITEEALYQPANNIRIGTTYLHLLNSKYFPQVNDLTKRSYLMIASYNWGPHRVQKLLNSKAKWQEAPANDIYHWLRALAPAETREYLLKVREYRRQFEDNPGAFSDQEASSET